MINLENKKEKSFVFDIDEEVLFGPQWHNVFQIHTLLSPLTKQLGGVTEYRDMENFANKRFGLKLRKFYLFWLNTFISCR